MHRKESPRVESVHRALVLLKLIIEEGSISVTEAAAALEVNASTAHRLLVTLVHDGFAVQREDRRYGNGPALAHVGGSGTTPPLVTQLRPAMEKLFDRVGETVHLAMLVGTRIQNLDGIEASWHPLRFSTRVGVWLPAHITSGGKALLADLSDTEVDARYTMAARSPRTHGERVDLVSLHEQLDDIRDSRIAWNFEESEPGLAAMSISIGAPHGQRAALSVALPIARFTKELGAKWSADLTEIADEFAAQAGGAPRAASAPAR